MKINLNHIKKVYFIGIGGIGMSALAFHFLKMNKQVFGFDKTPNAMSEQLEKKGAKIEYDENLNIAKKTRKNNTLVIYTPAIKENHPIYKYFKSNRYSIFKRAQILGQLSKDKTCIAVAGTHGKTTITSMLSYILKDNNLPVTGFLGGIAENYNSNYIHNGDDIFVIEADEFDRSFLNLQPDYALISNIDADHLDIYNTKEELEQCFHKFVEQLKDKTQLYHQDKLNFGGKTIGINNSADFHPENINLKDGTYYFDWVGPDQKIKNISLTMPGYHNLFNAISALCLAIAYKPEMGERFAQSLTNFKGVKRRFNYIVKRADLNIIDDYAHHPSEINAVYEAAKQMHPEQKVMGIFQPHLFSRTRDFADNFARQLSRFDEVKLLDIYPAREDPIEGINAKFLLEKVNVSHKQLIQKTDILHTVRTSSCKVIVLMGAGDIGVEAQHIKNYYKDEK
ncbi:UDP-N-acetylmuramate--L-alanine ligase [Mesohalobacter halotolerans]|uniref:UDP-N-acetylmuramate--L-alanine ligase n=1 Tax=Mesohalobacter halotolerans TaxID=1883405 RepID=A0A4U5TU16_9FLAO|nr:UDP-N-acetylmuramate--L-alanine ligase [Mesohalobacter halotolerans]MBS3739080.1 UDP-N-acetylmuramate--L-alanine ligase [Psychroflexus sp.]TKS57653.1 UDP-N-acetylmuramate--L-alanine ligase [Mesohalobacter halotolerans]